MMRARMIGAAVAASVALVTPAGAQSPLDGPLAAPGAETPTGVPAARTHLKAKPKKAHHANAKPAASPDPGDAPRATPADAPVANRPAAPAAPVDLGMKWNGTSDGSAQTRFQNGLDGSFGSGAEVGMKLHF